MTLVDTARDHSTRRLGQRILMLWILLYGFIGTQMTWRLSPFIGKPEDPFYLVKPSRDNFYVDVIHALQASLQIPASEVTWVAPLISASLCILTVGTLIFVGGLFLGTSFRKKPVDEQTGTN